MSVAYEFSNSFWFLLLVPFGIAVVGMIAGGVLNRGLPIFIAAGIALLSLIPTAIFISTSQEAQREDFAQGISEAYGINLSEELLQQVFTGKEGSTVTWPRLDIPFQGLYTQDGEKRSAVFYIAEVRENEYSLLVAGATSELIPFEKSEGQELQALSTDEQ